MFSGDNHSRVDLLGMVLAFAGFNTLPEGLAASQDKDEYISWHWIVGIDERVRAEYQQDVDLDASLSDNGSQFYHHLLFNVAFIKFHLSIL